MADINSPKELPIRLIGAIDPNDLDIIVKKLNELIVTVRTMNIIMYLIWKSYRKGSVIWNENMIVR